MGSLYSFLEGVLRVRNGQDRFSKNCKAYACLYLKKKIDCPFFYCFLLVMPSIFCLYNYCLALIKNFAIGTWPLFLKIKRKQFEIFSRKKSAIKMEWKSKSFIQPQRAHRQRSIRWTQFSITFSHLSAVMNAILCAILALSSSNVPSSYCWHKPFFWSSPKEKSRGALSRMNEAAAERFLRYHAYQTYNII